MQFGAILILILCVLGLFFINTMVANEFLSIAKEKGYNDNKYFRFCFWLGIVGYLMVIALPDRRNTNVHTSAKPSV